MKILIGTAIFLVCCVVRAEPSPLIQKAIDTPVSTLDMYLLRIGFQYQCNVERKHNFQYCIANIPTYFPSKNIIDVAVTVRAGSGEKYDAIYQRGLNDEEKKEAIKNLVESVAEWVGITNHDTVIFRGIFHTPIRINLWPKSQEWEKIRAEITRRIRLQVSIHSETGGVIKSTLGLQGEKLDYLVKRGVSGELDILRTKVSSFEKTRNKTEIDKNFPESENKKSPNNLLPAGVDNMPVLDDPVEHIFKAMTNDPKGPFERF